MHMHTKHDTCHMPHARAHLHVGDDICKVDDDLDKPVGGVLDDDRELALLPRRALNRGARVRLVRIAERLEHLRPPTGEAGEGW